MSKFNTISKAINLGPLVLLYYLSLSEIDSNFENYFEASRSLNFIFYHVF